MRKSHENLKVIRFEDEMLPNWAQLLDVAARLCPVSGPFALAQRIFLALARALISFCLWAVESLRFPFTGSESVAPAHAKLGRKHCRVPATLHPQNADPAIAATVADALPPARNADVQSLRAAYQLGIRSAPHHTSCRPQSDRSFPAIIKIPEAGPAISQMNLDHHKHCRHQDPIPPVNGAVAPFVLEGSKTSLS